jgi:hypothetical protein
MEVLENNAATGAAEQSAKGQAKQWKKEVWLLQLNKACFKSGGHPEIE